MNKDTLERLHETVHVPHGDPQLVLYTKLVVGLLWLVHLPLGFLYGAPLPFYLLLGGMMLLDGVTSFCPAAVPAGRGSWVQRWRFWPAAPCFSRRLMWAISAGFSC